jgi:hypothetical protein
MTGWVTEWLTRFLSQAGWLNEWLTEWLTDWLTDSEGRGETESVWKQRVGDNNWIQEEQKEQQTGRELRNSFIFLSFHLVLLMWISHEGSDNPDTRS